jgi:hypothetical protein
VVATQLFLFWKVVNELYQKLKESNLFHAFQIQVIDYVLAWAVTC